MLVTPPLWALGITACAVTVVCALCFKWLPLITAQAVLAMVVWNVSSISIGGALTYFYLAGPECVAGGPHFDYTYLTSLTSTVAAFASAVGLFLFYSFFSRHRYGTMFVSLSIAGSLATVFDLIIVTRFNRNTLGVSDKATYLFGDAMIRPMINMLSFMPSVLLMARLCPSGLESVMYAILAGVSNLSSTASTVLGIVVIKYAGVRTAVPCDFSPLPYLLVGCGAALPAIFLPVVYLLLPKQRMDEDLLPT